MTSTPLPEQGGDELRNKLIEKYMEVAASFYFEGSDSETERDEYAPEFADDLIQLILADRKQHELETLKSIAKDNYAEDLGTYDFDGIAEAVFHRIKELEQS